ncbi:MAG: antitoxin VapB family protein [Candidatus Micrarchaeota archaeon]|nr:antitoxin VapB family protein [Candidatus Micrarchaeota archaeon]MCX8154773.1 antitoxin VapB family protein [Candidatus Micrarchaeota archaeon]
MAKIITVRDEVYQRLRRIKAKLGMSFSDTIDFLMNIYDSHGTKSKILNLKGIINENYIHHDRMNRLLG